MRSLSQSRPPRPTACCGIACYLLCRLKVFLKKSLYISPKFVFSLVLDELISSRYCFPVVAACALQLAQYIDEADPVAYPTHRLYATLGVNLVLCAPPKAQQAEILQRVWSRVEKITSADDYVAVAEAWVEYPLNYLSTKEVPTLCR